MDLYRYLRNRKNRTFAMIILYLLLSFVVFEIGKYLVSLTMNSTEGEIYTRSAIETYRMIGKGEPKKFAIRQYDVIFKTSNATICQTIRVPYQMDGTIVRVSYWNFLPRLILLDVESPNVIYLLIGAICVAGICFVQSLENRSRDTILKKKKRKQ